MLVKGINTKHGLLYVVVPGYADAVYPQPQANGAAPHSLERFGDVEAVNALLAIPNVQGALAALHLRAQVRQQRV